MNRLANATSPYLLQHKDNPVDWYPWGDEAFERARAEDKPIFLSVGYSSCHWCHVMAHESFESEAVGAVLNEHFVSVKVDREERPDVDEAYMTAVQLASGRGGWPMSIFLTPDKRPFFAGTYFPREDRRGYPGFASICSKIAELWRTQRDDLEESARQFASGVEQTLGHPAPQTDAVFDQAFVDRAVETLSAAFDEVNGGFGGAPKFPPHSAIDFLLRYAARRLPVVTGAERTEPLPPTALQERARHMALLTLEKMALGGIHDHVGGGFHRYSTDAEWHLPHFEKMLYDNALMLANYASAGPMVRDSEREDAIGAAFGGIPPWLSREMTAPEGYFYSALDADSEGREGAFYVWTFDELRRVLDERAEAFANAYAFEAQGNFLEEASGQKTGENVLHRRSDVMGSFGNSLKALLAARSARTAPSCDTKGIVAWNGLMIAAMSTFVSPQAERAAQAILESESAFGRLPHLLGEHGPQGEAYLEDYAALAVGLFQLAAIRSWWEGAPDVPPELRDTLASREPEFWKDNANRLTSEMIALFWDDQQGGFFTTSERHEMLFGRTKPVFDQPIPSGNALALRCLIEVGDHDRARRLVQWGLGWMERAPHATEALYSAALPLLGSAIRRTDPKVVVRVEPEALRVDSDGMTRGEIVIEVPHGLHINAHAPLTNGLIATSVSANAVELRCDYPASVDGTYRGEIRIPFSARPGATDRGDIEVSYQACTDFECLIPEKVTLQLDFLR